MATDVRSIVDVRDPSVVADVVANAAYIRPADTEGCPFLRVTSVREALGLANAAIDAARKLREAEVTMRRQQGGW